MLAMKSNTNLRQENSDLIKNKLHVLIVEDDPNDKELILLELRRGGFIPDYKQVQTASEFKKEILSQNWDLVLCDYSMPNFDGLTALEILREIDDELPFFLISGEIADKTAVQAMKDGANDYLMKDNLHRLTPAITRELRDVQIRKENNKAQIAIIESEKRLREAERIAQLGNWELDHKSLKMVWSGQLYQIFEIENDQENISYEQFLSRIHPDDRIKTDLAIKQSIEYREPLEVLCRINLPGKKEKIVRMLSESVYDELNIPHRSLGVMQDVTKSIETEMQLKHSLNEKQVLISEIHHRVKNNLALIFSMLQLEMSGIEDERTKDILFNSIMRIRTMSLIHEKLYSITDFSNVPFHTFTSSLIQLLNDHFNSEQHITVDMELDEVLLNVNQAMPLALILNELLSNAYNHAFGKGSTGTISVKLGKKDDQINLTVADDGIGIPKSINGTETDSLGLTIINLLTKQLNGFLIISRNNGSEFNIQFTYNGAAKGSNGNFFPSITPHLRPYKFGELNNILQ